MGNLEKFDSIAEHYDSPQRIEIADIITREILGATKNTADKTLVDYGCGTGLIGLSLCDYFGQVLLVDGSENMVAQTAKKIHALGLSNARALCLNFEENPPTITADYIIVVQTLLHIQDITPILTRFYDMLSNGGHLIIVDFDKNEQVVSPDVHNGFAQDSLLQLVKQLGFSHAHAHTFYHGKQIFMRADASLFLLDATK